MLASELRSVAADPVHAGQPIRLRLNFRTLGGAERPELILDQSESRTRLVLPPEGDADAVLMLPTVRRGRMPVEIPDLDRISVRHHLGLVGAASTGTGAC